MEMDAKVNNLLQLAHEMKVLYVEDIAQIRENTKLILSTFFSEVVTASNGKEGIDHYTMNFFDIVITDIVMPEMNGLEMINKIKIISPTQRFIVTSSYIDHNIMNQLNDFDIVHFIHKPFDLDKILDVLHEVLCTNISHEQL